MATTAEQLLEEIEKLSEQQLLTAALNKCNELLKLFPSNCSGYRKRSHINARMGKYDAAISDRDHVIVASNARASDFFFRGIWHLRQGKPSSAVSDFTKVIEVESKDSPSYYTESAYYYRALAHLRLHSYSNALEDCRQLRDGFAIWVDDGIVSKHDIEKAAMERVSIDR